MAALRKSQFRFILSKWRRQVWSTRLPNYSSTSQVPNNSTSSHQSVKLPEKGNGSLNTIPKQPGPTDCCNEGCNNCVWFTYVIKVKFHYKHNEEKIKEALNSIPNPDKRAFVELELKKLERRIPKGGA